MGPPKPRSKRAAMDMDDGYSPMGQKKSKVGFKVNKVQNGYIISKRLFLWGFFIFSRFGMASNYDHLLQCCHYKLIVILRIGVMILIRHDIYLLRNL